MGVVDRRSGRNYNTNQALPLNSILSQEKLVNIPIPPIEMRTLVGPTDPARFDNPSGALVFPDVPIENYKRVFDFGCGCGRVARQLIQQTTPPETYRGVDIHLGMINWCQNYLTPVASNFTFTHHDVWNLGFNPGNNKPLVLPFPAENSSFSLVIAWSVFTHLLEQQAVFYLNEVSRILRPNGISVSTWFLFDKKYFPMMQEFQNALYINPVDLSNAVIFDSTWFRSAIKSCDLKMVRATPPALRGFQWVIHLSPVKSNLAEVELPEDKAPFGIARPPIGPGRDPSQIGRGPSNTVG